MSNSWYSKQFGEREHFAVHVSFSQDSRPTGNPEFDVAWGGFAIWVKGRCLTRSVSAETGVMEDVRWSLLAIFDWLTRVGVRLVNEEPFPEIAQGRVRDACDWYNETESMPATLGPAEEAAFFDKRSQWRDHHALRRAAVDAALPNIAFRRLGDMFEVSWDNETWSATQPGLVFVERRGSELVSARYVARILTDLCREATAELALRSPQPDLQERAVQAANLVACDRDWRWLVHPSTAGIVAEEFPELLAYLDDQTRIRKSRLFVPHCPETLVLRQVNLTSRQEIESLLQAIAGLSTQPMTPQIQKLVQLLPPNVAKPWEDGYEQALRIRDLLSWGDEPAPPLREWMKAGGIHISSQPLPESIDLIAARDETMAGNAILNGQGQRLGSESSSATALGHIICDEAGIFVESPSSHWLSSARAKAFAAMLLLPVDGVRKELEDLKHVSTSDIKRIMQRYGTTPYLTTFHLMNLGFISSDEERIRLVQDLAA